MEWKIKKSTGHLKGELVVPPDKSISHRAVIFASIAKGECRINNFLFAGDCMRTIDVFRSMGVEIIRDKDKVIVRGKGHRALRDPGKPLYMGNSGTSMRIISGILAGQNFKTELTGDESLSSRPMKRIVEPLRRMGAKIRTVNGDFPPIVIDAATGLLKAIEYTTPVPSAQVKSCILSAGLYADGPTCVKENFQSRDHTERILEYFSADIQRENLVVRIRGLQDKELVPKPIDVPGDISSAAFFIVGALLAKGSDIVLKNVGLNRTRIGVITVLSRMGASIEILNIQDGFEPRGDLRVKFSELKGTEIMAGEIPLLIDEVPMLIVAAVMAQGRTVIHDISELKVKESDRIKSMKDNLSKLGIEIYEENGALIIDGKKGKCASGVLDSFGDHRIAMSMAIMSLFADGDLVIKNTDCVDTSYPGFLKDFEKLKSV